MSEQEIEFWQRLRSGRDALLRACDWTQISDVPSSIDRAAWATYRQALRDLPASASYSEEDGGTIPWPTDPNGGGA